MKKIVVMLGAPIAVLAGILLYYTPEMPPTGVDSPHMITETVAATANARAVVATEFNDGLERLPRSLQGTQVDGVLSADRDGNLVINNDIRRVFDYFLSTIGDESLAEIEARLRAYIRHQLPANAAGQAEQLLQDYLAFNQAVSKLEATNTDTDSAIKTGTLRERLLSIQQLRHEYLPAGVIDAFYADDDAMDQLALGRMDIMQDPTLSEFEKTKALTSLEQTIPLRIQEIMGKLDKQQQMNTLTTHLRHNGGSDAAIFQVRESFFGADAAQRFAQLDVSREKWQARATNWLTQRDNLMSTEGIDDYDRQQLIDQARRDYFEANELKRIEIIENMHDQGLL